MLIATSNSGVLRRPFESAVYVMTGGGPANATHLFATYAYQIGIGTGLLSEGAAISLAMFPVLFLVVIIQLLYIRRVEVR